MAKEKPTMEQIIHDINAEIAAGKIELPVKKRITYDLLAGMGFLPEEEQSRHKGLQEVKQAREDAVERQMSRRSVHSVMTNFANAEALEAEMLYHMVASIVHGARQKGLYANLPPGQFRSDAEITPNVQLYDYTQSESDAMSYQRWAQAYAHLGLGSNPESLKRIDVELNDIAADFKIRHYGAGPSLVR